MSQTTNQVIPEGYKQTEVGVIPLDWKIKNLGDFATVSSGGTPNRKVADYWDGDIPWVTTTLINGGDISYANEFITQKGLDNSSARMCKVGSILMAMYGQGKTRGKAGVLTINASINQACAAIEVNKKSSKEYILQTLNHMYEEIRELSNSGGQENLSSGIIKGIKIPLPSKSEQTAIANALSDVDALLCELEKLIAKKQAIKTATMQQLLTGKTRLPQFSTYTEDTPEGKKKGQPKGMKASELGEIPEDWNMINFGALFEHSISRKTLKEDTLTSFVGMQDVSEDARLVNQTSVLAGKVKSGFTYFEQGDVLVAKITPCFENGKGFHAKSLNTQVGFGSTEFHVLRAKNHNNSDFIYFWTTRDILRQTLESEMVGSAGHRRVPFTAIQNYKIPCAQTNEEQTAIATILSDMDNEIQALQQRLSKTRQIKQGMMQELLTGKTRLPFDKPKEQGETHAD